MKGDFSRCRFDPEKHYTAVLEQQGRVQLDADANEQRAIDAHRLATETIDVIGATGAPKHAAGFAISLRSDNASAADRSRSVITSTDCSAKRRCRVTIHSSRF